MDAEGALAELMEISSQVESAALLGEQDELLASTLSDESRARELARAARELLATADAAGSRERPVRQIEAETAAGSVFVVRGEKAIAVAATGRSPTSALVFYDLKTCLRALERADDAAA